MKILFVCNGNICRSIIAQELFKKMLEEKGLSKKYEITSAGLIAFSGQAPIEKTIRNTLNETGIDVSNYRAVNIADIDVTDSDLILCMTGAQKLQLQNRYKDMADRIYTLKEYVIYDNADNVDRDIEDPYNAEDEVFIDCINQIRNSLHKLLIILE